jgi:hypothetical protein
MIATIFEFEPNESLRILFQDLFRQYVSSSVTVQSEPPYNPLRYIKLLQAAIPPERGISLTAETFSVYAYRVYIKAYFSIRNIYGGDYRSFLGSDVSEFFPAVAVQDRMVFVPVGLARTLVGSIDEMPPFSALKEGGVLELDYQNETAIKNAVQVLAEILRREFMHNLQAYSEFENAAELDLQKIADDLNTDIDYVRHVLKGETRAFERSAYGHIGFELTPRSGPLNHWTKATLKLENNSDTDLTNVLVKIKGPVSVLREPIRTSLPAHSTIEETISIKPHDPGEFPIEISCVLPEDKSFADWIRGKAIWFTSTT